MFTEEQWAAYENERPISYEPGSIDIDYKINKEWLEYDIEIYWTQIISRYTDINEPCNQDRKLTLEFWPPNLVDDRIHPEMFRFYSKEFSKFKIKIDHNPSGNIIVDIVIPRVIIG